jgi:hypothetical protein
MTEPAPVKAARDTLLLSHANPEDNEFTLWLALQLANEAIAYDAISRSCWAARCSGTISKR